MSLPFTIPDWLPWWVPFAVLVPALLYALIFLFMPFSVIGVRGRLDSIEARLDEIQGEIRSLALRLPEPLHITEYDDPPPLLTRAQQREEYHPPSPRPPIPPAPHYPDTAYPEHYPSDGQPGDGPYRGPRPAGVSRPRPADQQGAPRAEPRLDWPRGA